MLSERDAFRQIALKLLEIRTFDDYDAITKGDWIDEWLKEAAQFAEKLYDAELNFACREEGGYSFTGRETPIFEPPKGEK
jgi:hypothetical protein